jgi:hypothetical protein
MRLALVVALLLPAAALGDLVLVSDPAALARLEARGLGLGERLGEARAATAAELARGPRWRTIAGAITADLAAIQRADPRSGVGVARNAHRLFDARWLDAGFTRFELIGVLNRIDRRPLVAAGCGETRFVYRLAYTRDGVSSRLPMTVTVDYRNDDDCAAAARRFRPPAGADPVEFLLSPAGLVLDPAHLALVQVNLQSVRWPSAVRPDLAAHAEYLLRAFRPAGAGLAAAPLDNTPDVPRLRRDRALRRELLAWIGANLSRIDDGTAVLPERFAAEVATSVAPRGLARRANRPFRQLFAPAELAALDLSEARHARTPAALLRRLDDATCAGCHQARSLAGFHFLGEDAPETVAGNALAVPRSPHLESELARRRAITAAFAGGAAPDLARPFSERAAGEPGGYGARCGRGDPSFAGWTCAAGLACDVYDAPPDDDEVGVCLPPRPGTGDPCQVGRVAPHADPHRDRIPRAAARACPGACNTNKVGFPGGMCTAGCDDPGPDGTCGSIAILTPFNNCLARKVPFPRCLAENTRPTALRACDAARPCRDDYLCGRIEGDRGACIPPYFLFQMRVDGHP